MAHSFNLNPQKLFGPSPWVAPLFPLPNVVLLPRAVLPLHIFEERYKSMTSDALSADGLIAMALLRPGWEKNYHDRPQIHPVVCMGKILTHEKLPDGKYNFLLQGLSRGRIDHECACMTKPYRLAEIHPIPEIHTPECELSEERKELISLMDSPCLRASCIGQKFAQLLEGPLSTPEVVDLLAFTFLEDVQFKQNLLAEPNPCLRVRSVIQVLRDCLAASVRHPYPKPSLN